MRIHEIVAEAKFRKPVVMFHGTSTAFLREILKKGLLPSAKKAVYDKDSDTMTSGLPKKTLGGVYFSKSSRVARSSALQAANKFGGGQLIVIAQIAEQSSYADEDTISDTTLDIFKEVMGVAQYNDPSAIRIINKLLDPAAHSELEKLFTEKLHTALDKNNTIPEKWNGYSTVFDAVAAFFIDLDINNVPATDEYNNKLKTLEDRGINYDDGRSEIRKAQELLTRRYKSTVYDEPGEYEKFHALRVTTAVNYSGSNKILAIIELGSDFKDPIKLHYGDANIVLKYYKPSHENTVGSWPGLVD